MEGLKPGRMVYYVAFGTPGGEYPAGVERAAIVTEVPEIGKGGPAYADCQVIDGAGTQTTVGLCVVNPTGLFFRQGVKYDDGKAPGTWHWMFEGQAGRYDATKPH